MHRFFIEPEQTTTRPVVLEQTEAHHLRSVLRLNKGDKVELLDGAGGIYQAIVLTTEPQATLEITGSEKQPTPRPALHLGQSLLKGQKIDLVIQKATELGASSITPFTSTYTNTAKPGASKIKRWQKITKEACKQCRQAHPLKINQPNNFKNLIASGKNYQQRFIFWENEQENSLASISELGALDTILIILGPEGGFSEEEVKMAQENGFISLSLGSLVMRAETAAISAMAIIQFLSGRLTHHQ